MYADLETYFVVNDADDQEYFQASEPVHYYPRPGVKIGDLDPTGIMPYYLGKPWGGIGVRVSTRGYQWNNLQARDAMFWEYDITNISDYDLPQVGFGYYVDNAIGGNYPYDDLGNFVQSLNMAYAWDFDGIGEGGGATGTEGFAYLESPGLAYDGIDNDNDGLTDEKRDNLATVFLTDSTQDPFYTNAEKFHAYYGHYWRPHWDADENQDWRDGQDLNGNGKYDVNEDAGDDVGLDGVGPNDLNYTGPDADGTECNHKPDLKEGIGAEPDFGYTDVNESDMLGLTAFQMWMIPDPHPAPYLNWFRNDKSMWDNMNQAKLVPYTGALQNLAEFFASCPFTLYKGRTERYSMALVYSYENLIGLNSPTHDAPSLFIK
jgi:hypothetical protein